MNLFGSVYPIGRSTSTFCACEIVHSAREIYVFVKLAAFIHTPVVALSADVVRVDEVLKHTTLWSVYSYIHLHVNVKLQITVGYK